MLNAKTIIWLAILCIASVGGFMAYTSYSSQPTTEQLCTIENPVWCDALIEWLTVEYNKLEKAQSELNKKADVYRAIKKLEISPTITGGDEKLNESN